MLLSDLNKHSSQLQIVLYMSSSWAGTMFPEYIRLIVSRLGLPSEYDYWLAEHSPIIPQKSITT